MGTSNLDRLIDSRTISDIQDHQYCKSSSSQTPIALKIQVPYSAEEFKDNNPKTPRSVEHRIPVMATCPPAPRKANKRVPTTGKRRRSCFPVVGVPADFVVYLDTMLALNQTVYVPDIVVGDLAKKLKLLPPTPHQV